MIYLENFKIAITSLWTHKVRAFLTVLGILIGVFSVIMIIAIVTGLKDDIRGMIVSLGGDVLDVVPAKVEGFQPTQMMAHFEKNEVEALKEQSHLFKNITECYEFAGDFEYRDEKISGFGLGIEPSYFKIREKDVLAGRLFSNLEQRGAEKVVVIGAGVAKKLFGSYERALGRILKIDGKEFEVVGVLEEEDFKMGGFDINDSVYVPSSVADKVFGAKLSEVFIKAHSESVVDETTREVEKTLNRVRGEGKFSVMAQKDMLKVVDQITQLLTAALAGLASISLLVGGIGIMNIMLVSVRERTREIGIRKAIGARNRDILTQFLMESTSLSLLGGVVGMALGIGGAMILPHLIEFLPTHISLWSIGLAFSFSAAVGIFFGVYPARKASLLDPIVALRFE